MWKKLTLLYGLIRKDLRIVWHALVHPNRPAWLRPAVAGLVIYVLSPIDLIPDFIPVIGIMDDTLIVTMGIAWIVRNLPEDVRRAAENRASATTVEPR